MPPHVHRRGKVSTTKLNPGLAMKIRQLYHDEGWTQGQLSREYKVSIGQIGRIVRNEAWQEVDPEPTLSEMEHRSAMLQHKITPELIAASQARMMALVNEGRMAASQEPESTTGIDKLQSTTFKVLGVPTPEETIQATNDLEDFLK